MEGRTKKGEKIRNVNAVFNYLDDLFVHMNMAIEPLFFITAGVVVADPSSRIITPAR